MKRIAIAAWRRSGGAAILVRSDRYGLMAAGLALLPVTVLLVWPQGVPVPIAPAGVSLIDARLADAFIDNAPFDPLHRRETSVAPLDGRAQPTLSETVDTPLIIGGIMLLGDERQVMFSSEPTVWYHEGEIVRDWLIRHIEPETIIMTKGAEIMTLTYRAALESLNGPMSDITQP